MFDDIFNGMFKEFEEIERRMTEAFDHRDNGVRTYDTSHTVAPMV
jgi:hypothetical protein